MYFYEVAPSSRQYHGNTLLTYSSQQELEVGQLVVVKIRSRVAVAFIIEKVDKPKFKTANVDEVLNIRLPVQHLALFSWLREYYPAPVGLIAQLFLPFSTPKSFIVEKIKEDPQTETSPPPPLTAEQKVAVLTATANDYQSILLHGDTGTGKTRVYIELAARAIEEGKSVLILVPEIALSPQIVNSFKAHISAHIRVTHSGLTLSQRRKVWQAITKEEQPQIVIGPRSALFTPLKDVGLVVIDEFHEPAYKQDQAPYYQTTRVASQFARLHNARLIMGSATPPVSEYYIAQQKEVPIVRMKQKALREQEAASHDLVSRVVNLKDEAEKTKYPLISQTLLEAIKRTLDKREQALLFLNKRGSARIILCQNCGWHATCERCDLPLTYHADSHSLQCHTCGFKLGTPSICPSCSSHDIIFKSPGTKAIVEAIQRAFPEANVARFDKDNLKAERLEARHQEIIEGDIDILIGTQLLAKGHDLPRLSLVGVLLAENELQFPDYTSSERSYQLMHQLIGRVGRGHLPGEVVVQTYDPSNEAVTAAVGQKAWEDFYESQLSERRVFGFPPFSFLMKIEVSRARLATVERACEQIIDFLEDSDEPIQVVGPIPSFIEKRNNTYNWQIIVKTKQRTILARLAENLPIKTTVNLDPSNLL